MTSAELQEIVGDHPLVWGSKRLGFIPVLMAVCIIFMLNEIMVFWSVVLFWMLCVVGFFLGVRVFLRLFEIPAYNRVKRGIVQKEINVDFFIPARFRRGGHFIVDRLNDAIHFGGECCKLSELKEFGSGEDGKTGTFHLVFESGDRPKKVLYVSSFEMAHQQELRLLNFLGW